MENLKPIKDIEINKIKNFTALLKAMKESGGYTAKKIGIAFEILKEMLDDKECLRILTFPAALVATGCRGLLKELVKRKIFDVVITASGSLDHDLARIWKPYYHGSFNADDKQLHKKGINREGNIFIPIESYGIILEEKLRPIFKEIYSKEKDIATYELINEIYKCLEKEENKEESIFYWCYKNNIPVFLPGPLDGAFGYQLWLFWQNNHKDLNLNIMKDESKIDELFYKAKKTGALMLGGGITKHHCIWWNQFRGGLDYAVYITTAPEWDGSLSGAKLKEAVSWGKIKENAKFITVEGEVTALLPLIVKALIENL